MIKTAIKRPDVVLYIEFKGKENFKEVCEFIGESAPLMTDEEDEEYLLLNYYISNKETIRINEGRIFYKWYDYNLQIEQWGVMKKTEFFERYMEEDK